MIFIHFVSSNNILKICIAKNEPLKIQFQFLINDMFDVLIFYWFIRVIMKIVEITRVTRLNIE